MRSGETGREVPGLVVGKRLSRRTFLEATAMAGGLFALSAIAPGAPQGKGKGGGGGGGGARNPLFVPPTRAAAGLTLTCGEAAVDVGGGQMSNVWAYDGFMPGPTIVARAGDTADIRLVNELPEHTITHWHGMLVDEANDGGPFHSVPVGGMRQYQFPILNRACMNWYHPHPHHLTGKQVNLGLAGAFLIRDAVEDEFGLPAGPPFEVPLVIRDANFNKQGNLEYKPRSSGFVGKVPLVNGTLSPKLDVHATVLRLRVLNGSNARIFRLALDNGAPFHVIGNDGGLLERTETVGEFTFSSGERLDLLVDFRGLRVGTDVMLVDLNSGWKLLEFHVAGTMQSNVQIPGALPTIEHLADPVVTRTFSFDGMSRINGLEFDMDRIDFDVPFGQVERWVFTSNGNAPHPVHVHGASFQVVSRTGGRAAVFPWELGWKDTVLLEDQETVEVLIRFDSYGGGQRYVLHCHKLEHEDHGMMSAFRVT